MDSRLLRTIVIVGGGTAGWMTAAALARLLQGRYRIRLVESEEIGTVGVGEATIPMIRLYNQVVGIDENEMLRATQGTFKMGIEFVDWWRRGERYMHAFGRVGQELSTVNFEHYWRRMRHLGRAADLEEYSIDSMAARENRFLRPQPDMAGSPLADINYAFHFDASLYARFLRTRSEAGGVERIEGKISGVELRPDNGFVAAVHLADGRRVDGELFLDCSGFRGLLIEQTLRTGFEDWSEWLPNDRAVAVPCTSAKNLLPYTRSTAHRAGWQWRIPLQHRIGNGHVFCSRYMSEDEATAILLGNLDGQPTADPRTLRFTAGMRKLAWNRNVIAVGLASGFLEPLESTSIHLVQTMIARTIAWFPDKGFNQADIDEFNRQSRFEYEKIRDFIILHYHATERDDSPYWDYCRTMRVPESLRNKMDVYLNHGRTLREGNELFAEVSWLQVMHGQGLRPQGWHPLADVLPEDEVADYLENIRQTIRKCVAVMPDHAEFIRQHCAAPS
ncbi:MAG: tryptophan 7-halogenase [Sinobacteraceae bacterium]|nr:tryptophan 7-halogenase [Nevskiaceae bacterium]